MLEKQDKDYAGRRRGAAPLSRGMSTSLVLLSPIECFRVYRPPTPTAPIYKWSDWHGGWEAGASEMSPYGRLVSATEMLRRGSPPLHPSRTERTPKDALSLAPYPVRACGST